MIELLGLIGIAALLVGKYFFDQTAAEWRRKDREAIAAESERVRECGEVALFYANHLGYAARSVIDRNQLEKLVDSGISPERLLKELGKRCAAVPGPLLGHEILGETRVPVVLPESFRTRHLYMVGRSGSGKTTLIRRLILQDLAAGHGLAVIAPELELVEEELLPFVPEHRLDDIIYVNPADTSCPVPFNPLHLDEGEDLDLKVAETLGIFHRLFDDEGGGAPRMETILRQALYTLMQVPGSTLLDLERLLDRQDDAFRKRLLRQIADEDARRFWESVYPAYPKDAHLAILNRLGRLLRPKVVRSLLCAPGKSLNVRRCLDEGKVLFFALSDGILGEQNAQLLGQLAVAKIQLGAMARADQPKEARRPFTVYIDEFQGFCSAAATSYEVLLSRARKYGVGLVLAHQQTGQIPEVLMREILGNVSSIVAFNVGATDARRLARELIGEFDGQPVSLDPKELLSLRVGEAVCRIGRSVLRLKTLPVPEGGRASVREEAIRRSRLLYGAPSMPSRNGKAVSSTPLERLDPGEVFGS